MGVPAVRRAIDAGMKATRRTDRTAYMVEAIMRDGSAMFRMARSVNAVVNRMMVRRATTSAAVMSGAMMHGMAAVVCACRKMVARMASRASEMRVAHVSPAKMSAAHVCRSGVSTACTAMLVICRRGWESHETGNRKCG